MSSAGEPAGLPPHDPLQKETYVALIRRAIGESPDGALTLNEIYDAMERKHPDIALNRPGWKNTTRHCLSMNPCFVNQSKPFPLPGRGGYWTVDVNAPESYSRNRSKKKPARSKTSSVSPASLTAPLPSSKRTRRKSGPANASASSSKGRGTFSTTGPDEDHRNVGSSSYPGSSGVRVDGRDDGGSMLGLDEGSEESDEGERRSDPQLPPWTQPQHQQQRYHPPPPGPSYPLPLPHQNNYAPYPTSYNPQGYSNNFPPPINPYIPHPSSSSHHLHPLPPFQMHPQQQQQQQQLQQNHQHYQQQQQLQQQPPFPPFPNSSYSPRLSNQNPIHHYDPQQPSLPPFIPRMDHPTQYRTNSSSPLLSLIPQRLPDTLANLVDSGEGSSSTSKEVPES